jgi:hypothetical protein
MVKKHRRQMCVWDKTLPQQQQQQLAGIFGFAEKL